MRFTALALLALFGCSGDKPDESGTTPTTGDTVGTATGAGTATGTGTGTGTGTATGTGTGTGSTGATLVVGNGASTHAPASPGDPVTMVHGPQGGWHIEVSGEVTGLGAVVGVYVEATRVADGTVVGSNNNATFLQLAEYDDVAATGWFAGERALVDADLEGICALDGVALELCAEAEDLAVPGTFASGCVEVSAALDPADVALCAGTGTTGTGTGTGSTSTGGGTVP